MTADRAAPLLVPEPERTELARRATQWPSVTLDEEQRGELELLLGGALAPRHGWDADDPLHVRVTGTAETAQGQGAVGDAAHIVLRDSEGVALAVLDVDHTAAEADGVALAGTVRGLAMPVHHDLAPLRRTASEVASSLADTGRAVGVVLTRPLHPADVAALSAQAGADPVVLVLAAVDLLDRWALARAVEPAIDALGSDRVHAVVVPESPWLADQLASHAGREDLLGNHGATEYVDADDLAPDVHAQVVDAVAAQRPVGDDLAYRAAVVELARALRPPIERGLVVFLTGLSGSGKSTVAQVVAARLREAGQRDVTLLDGDVVRTHLSAGLGFSPEDRDRNVRRIGWVAAEIAGHGGTVIACPIAPYDDARRANRAAAEAAGAGFVLVHVATPLEVCEARDRKGLYAKARAGAISGFTGIDAPYEEPTDAEVVIDTTDLSAEEAAQRVLEHLRAGGWIS